GPPPDLGERDRPLPDPPPREPVPLQLLARAGRPRAGRLVARDTGQGRERSRQPEPDRRHDAGRPGRCGAPARLREGPGRACHARGPRPQRPLAGLPTRHRPRATLPGARALLPRHPPGLGGGGRAPGRSRSLRAATRLLPRRDRRRLGPSCRARGVPAEARRARDRDYPGGGAAVILLVDNYDSFTYNLVHLFQELGAEVVVERNDAIDADEAERLRPSHLVVSPGPGRPADSGSTLEIVRRLAPGTPTLGVCLGHQA